MHPFVKWLIGLRQLPQEAGEGAWHVEFQSLPKGMSALLVAAIGIAAVVLIWQLYRWEGRNLSVGARILIGGLRVLTLISAALMLCDLVLVIDRRERVPANLIMLVDTSESMGLTDPYDDATARKLSAGLRGLTDTSETDAIGVRELNRLELAKRGLEPIWRDLAEDRQLAVYGFDGKPHRLTGENPLTALKPRGPTTAVGNALAEALAAHRGQPLAGVLVVTDGQSNVGEDPRKIAQQAGKDSVKISALVVGSEKGPSNVRITELEASPVVFVRDPVPLSVLVESQGMPGRTATVKLDRRQSGEEWLEVGGAEITLSDDGSLQRIPFVNTPDSVGQYEFRARLVDVGPELTQDDNSALKTVRVVRQRIRVLILAGSPSPEVQFLRNALLRDPLIEMTSWLQSANDLYEQIGHRPVRRLPANIQELTNFDVIVLIDPDTRKLGSDWNELLTKFVGEAGGGLIFIAGELFTNRLLETGENASSDQSWVGMLPVVSEPGLYQSTADVRLSARETWNLELTAEGNDDPIFQFAPDPAKNREILASLPGMYWHFPVTRAKPGATILAQHGDQRMRNQFGRHCLMAVQRYGPGRTVFIAFDATYRWRYLHEQYFDGFWARLIDRVGRAKVLGGRYPFTLASDKSVYRIGDRVLFSVRMFGGAEEVASLGSLQTEVEIPGSEPIALDLEPNPEQTGVFEASFTVEKGGLYSIRVSSAIQAERDNSVRPATHTFRVEPPRQETDRPGTNRPLLEDITKAADGQVFSLENCREIPAAFPTKQVERLFQYREELWDAPLWMFLIVTFLTAEWVLRKLYRMA